MTVRELVDARNELGRAAFRLERELIRLGDRVSRADMSRAHLLIHEADDMVQGLGVDRVAAVTHALRSTLSRLQAER